MICWRNKLHPQLTHRTTHQRGAPQLRQSSLYFDAVYISTWSHVLRQTLRIINRFSVDLQSIFDRFSSLSDTWTHSITDRDSRGFTKSNASPMVLEMRSNLVDCSPTCVAIFSEFFVGFFSGPNLFSSPSV